MSRSICAEKMSCIASISVLSDLFDLLQTYLLLETAQFYHLVSSTPIVVIKSVFERDLVKLFYLNRDIEILLK